MNTQTIVNRLQTIYGDEYTYEKVNYKSMRDKIIITCIQHGLFAAFPSNLLHGHGCPKCRIENR